MKRVGSSNDDDLSMAFGFTCNINPRVLGESPVVNTVKHHNVPFIFLLFLALHALLSDFLTAFS